MTLLAEDPELWDTVRYHVDGRLREDERRVHRTTAHRGRILTSRRESASYWMLTTFPLSPNVTTICAKRFLQ